MNDWYRSEENIFSTSSSPSSSYGSAFDAYSEKLQHLREEKQERKFEKRVDQDKAIHIILEMDERLLSRILDKPRWRKEEKKLESVVEKKEDEEVFKAPRRIP